VMRSIGRNPSTFLMIWSIEVLSAVYRRNFVNASGRDRINTTCVVGSDLPFLALATIKMPAGFASDTAMNRVSNVWRYHSGCWQMGRLAKVGERENRNTGGEGIDMSLVVDVSCSPAPVTRGRGCVEVSRFIEDGRCVEVEVWYWVELKVE
jgi:hypothetical protein